MNNLETEFVPIRTEHPKNPNIEVVTGIKFAGKRGRFLRVLFHVCKQDSELYGDGTFLISVSNFNKGHIPCGCSKNPLKTADQWKILIKRKLEGLPYKFIDFYEEFKGTSTRCIMECPAHGRWNTGVISNIMAKGSMCTSCKYESNAWNQRLTDEEAKELFLASGAFHPDTKFWRSDKENKAGKKPYWFIECYDCGEIRESYSASLQKGAKPCYCGRHNPNHAYVAIILDNEIPIGLKFGITARPKERVAEQHKKSIYDFELISVYRFVDVTSCRKSETQVKKEMDCGIFTPVEVPDGYTETTFVYNLDKILAIYESNGGVPIEI